MGQCVLNESHFVRGSGFYMNGNALVADSFSQIKPRLNLLDGTYWLRAARPSVKVSFT
jgi:hypothetical protein